MGKWSFHDPNFDRMTGVCKEEVISLDYKTFTLCRKRVKERIDEAIERVGKVMMGV